MPGTGHNTDNTAVNLKELTVNKSPLEVESRSGFAIDPRKQFHFPSHC